jgi:hypothetical protein
MPARHATDALPGLQRLFNQPNLVLVIPATPTFSAQYVHLHRYMTLRLDLRLDPQPGLKTVQGGPRRSDTSQGWRTLLRNHAPDIAAMDLFVVPTIGFDLL